MSVPSEEVWPFLVCRGRTVGSRVVVAPDILSDGRLLTSLLTQRPEGRTRWPVPADPDGYEIVVRNVILDASWTGSTVPVLDDESRPVDATEGAIVRGGRSGDDEVLALVRRVVTGPFADFWRADDPGWDPVLVSGAGRIVDHPASRQLDLRSSAPRETAKPSVAAPPAVEPDQGHRLDEGHRPGPTVPAVLVAILAVLVVVVVLALAT